MTNSLQRWNLPKDAETASIGQRIRAARKALNLNQEELAQRLGVTQPTVANWEADVHNPRQFMLAKLSESLSVSLGWLAGGETGAVTGPGSSAGVPYLARGLLHVPVIPMEGIRSSQDVTKDSLHAAAIDYIPITARSGQLFATFMDAGPYSQTFPGETLFVFDASRTVPVPGCYTLLLEERGPSLHHWPEQGTIGVVPKAMGEVLGTLSLTIRFF